MTKKTERSFPVVVSTGNARTEFYDDTTRRGMLGFGSAGNIFSSALTNSVGLRSEAALQLGVGSTVIFTMREIGYSEGTGYTAIGGETDPLSVFEVGGEASPEIGVRSNTTGRRYTLMSNSDKDFYLIDRTDNVDRARVGHPESLANDGVRVLPNYDGVLFAVDHSGAFTAMYFLRKSTASQEVSDPSAGFSPTKDNAGTINIYWDAGNARFEMQNKNGAARILSFWALGRS